MNVIEVVRYLQENQYAAPGKRTCLKKSKVYADIKSNVFRVQNERSITEAEVAEYIMKAGLVPLSGNAELRDDAHARRADLQAALLEVRRQREQFELDRARGAYLLRSDVEMQFAIKWAAIDASIRHLLHTRARDWIYAVGGRGEKKDVLVALVGAELDELFNRLATIDELQLSLVVDENESAEQDE
jgi:hypothetical protein